MIVAVWNMQNRTAGWRHLFDVLQPDVALLQETVAREDARDFGAVVAAPAHPHLPWGSAIIVRGGNASELPLPDEHRGWLVAAEVTIGNQPPFVAISVHGRISGLPGNKVRPNIDRAFEAVEPLIRGRTFVLGGDLNLSRNYKRSDAAFLDALPSRGFVDCMRKFYAEEQPTNLRKNLKGVYQNDHVFVSRDLDNRVESCTVADAAGLSDHAPLRMVIRDQPLGTPSKVSAEAGRSPTTRSSSSALHPEPSPSGSTAASEEPWLVEPHVSSTRPVRLSTRKRREIWDAIETSGAHDPGATFRIIMEVLEEPRVRMGRPMTTREGARAFIASYLSLHDGEVAAGALLAAAKEAGFSYNTIRRAADDMNVVRTSGRNATWTLAH